MTGTPREKAGEGVGVGFDPSHLSKRDWYSVSDADLLVFFIPTPFPTFIVFCVSVSHGLRALTFS